MLKKPLAWLPLAMSLAALALVVGHYAVYGTVREADEGTAAHLFQILIAAQAPIVLAYAVKGLSRAPRETLFVLTLQALGVLAALGALFFLEHRT